MHPHGAYVRGARRNRIDRHGGGIERLGRRTSSSASRNALAAWSRPRAATCFGLVLLLISSGPPRVRCTPMGVHRTCGGPGDIEMTPMAVELNTRIRDADRGGCGPGPCVPVLVCKRQEAHLRPAGRWGRGRRVRRVRVRGMRALRPCVAAKIVGGAAVEAACGAKSVEVGAKGVVVVRVEGQAWTGTRGATRRNTAPDGWRLRKFEFCRWAGGARLEPPRAHAAKHVHAHLPEPPPLARTRTRSSYPCRTARARGTRAVCTVSC